MGVEPTPFVPSSRVHHALDTYPVLRGLLLHSLPCPLLDFLCLKHNSDRKSSTRSFSTFESASKTCTCSLHLYRVSLPCASFCSGFVGLLECPCFECRESSECCRCKEKLGFLMPLATGTDDKHSWTRASVSSMGLKLPSTYQSQNQTMFNF